MDRATELAARAQRLAEALRAWSASSASRTQADFATDALALLGLQQGRLRDLMDNRSKLPEPNVYLSVSSLNKGFLEIGGDWLEDPALRSLANSLTEMAYAFYKQTRA